MMPSNLHKNFPRGGSEQTEAAIAQAKFATTKSILNTPALAFQNANPEGKIFLGVVDGDVYTSTLSDSRVVRHVESGYPIAVGDDRHILTVAGSRAGKGRSVIIPNLLLYPGSILTIESQR